MIKKIDLQIYNYCNRECWFCPPYSKKIKDKVEYIDTEKVLKFIKYGIENKYINPNGMIQLHRYSEPFVNFNTMNKFAETIKKDEITRNLRTEFHSNGDLKTLEELYNLNTDNIDIIHLGFYDETNKNIVDYMSECYDIGFRNVIIISKKMNYFKCTNKYNTEFRIMFNKEKIYKENNVFESRGGIINKLEDNKPIRTNVCTRRTVVIGIDSNGNIMPCCDLYSRNKEHEEYILGNIYTDTPNDIFEKHSIEREKILPVCIRCGKE